MVLAATDTPHFRLDELQRALGRALPAVSLSTAGGPPLELSAAVDPPLIAGADVVEDDVLRARAVTGAPALHFTAFLDGTQRSDLMAHAEDGAPIVLGVTAAVVRQWTQGRATTWAHAARQRVYAPRRAMRGAEWDAIAALGPAAIDTTADEPALADAHPLAHRDAALQQIHRDREQLEHQVAQKWCAERSEALYVDGGLRGSVILARAAQTVGVIKSHRTLYGDAMARRVILGLDERERSSVFVVASPSRVPVASWYLRLRSRAGRDPLWGLVRVEVRHEPDAPRATITARADDVSRRILAERSPTAHPDGRWDTMAYGIRDCEVFLRAIQ